jgi:para-aminobenzoate synthetase component 1
MSLHENIPIAESLECPIALVHDRHEKLWWIVGDEQCCTGLEDFLGTARSIECRFRCEPLNPLLDDEQYAHLVEKTIEYVHAGDIFQANISRRFSTRAEFEDLSQRRAFSAALLAESGAWFGAIIELPRSRGDETIVSLSPELFLQFDPVTRVVRSRPIKGTLPAGCDPGKLERSDKDAAELAMIVDLMRNDIGRVARIGSVRVCQARAIESHPGVIHGVADIQGTLLDGVGLGRLLQATFPPGSVSGAPKVRAMQIIDELEPVRRGPYCGSLGYSSACGRLALDVSIRTLLVKSLSESARSTSFSHEVQYGAGCGIVAESTPLGEAAESTAKAALLARFLVENSSPQARSVEHVSQPTC